MSSNPEPSLRVLSLDGGGIRGLSSLMILAKVMEVFPARQVHKKIKILDKVKDGVSGVNETVLAGPVYEEARPCDHFRCITGSGMGGVLALLLGRLKLTVSQCMSEYWKLSSLILRKEDYSAESPLFDKEKLEMVMHGIIRKYYPDELPLKDSIGATKVFVYGVQKDGAPFCIRTYDSKDEQISSISIPQAATAICAARGMFAEVSVEREDKSVILCWDKGHPLGLVDPIELALREIEQLFPQEPVHSIISIGAGDVAVNDIPDLLRLAYPSPIFSLSSMFQRRQVPEDEMSTAREGLRDPKKLYDTLRNHRRNIIERLPLGVYRRLEIGPVEDVGPDDFLSTKEVSETTKQYLRSIGQHLTQSLLFGGESTALHWAAWTGNIASLDSLSPTTRDLDDIDDKGRTPLSYAAENGHLEVTVKLLRVPFVNPDIKDKKGRSALSYAAENGHVAVMKLLPHEVKDLNYSDGDYRTPLSRAAENGYLIAVKQLLQWNSYVNIKDAEGRTPLWYAEKGSHNEVARVLRMNSTNVDLSLAEIRYPGLKQDKAPDLAMMGSSFHQERQEYTIRTTAEEADKRRNASDGWFSKLHQLTRILSLGSEKGNRNYDPIRVAILDTGIRADGAKQVKIYKDLISNDGSFMRDNTGHGTNSAKLILSVFPDAELYVARVSDSDTWNRDTPDLIAEAIRLATQEWKADIINIMSGSLQKHDVVNNAIMKSATRTIFFAGASSTTANFEISSLARMRDVIHIFCADADNHMSPFNPAPSSGKYNFAIFGNSVPVPESTEFVAGSSFAACIATGVAGQLLDFSRQTGCRDRIRNVSRLSTMRGMSAVFEYMAIKQNGYDLICPWRLIEDLPKDMDEKRMREEICAVLSRALEEFY